MKTISDFLKVSNAGRLSIYRDVWVVWNDSEFVWIVYLQSPYARFARERYRTDSEEDLVLWLTNYESSFEIS